LIFLICRFRIYYYLGIFAVIQLTKIIQMKRFLFIFFLFITLFEVQSQIITSTNVQGIDCNNSIGYIALSIDIPTPYIYWDSITPSGVAIQMMNVGDSISFSYCGNYRARIYNSTGILTDSSTYYISCLLGVSPSFHRNVACYGDSTGSLKGLAYGGALPYLYSWYKNGTLYSSGINDTVIDNLQISQYKVVVTDSIGCQDSVISNISQPTVLRIDTLIRNSVHCKGTNTGSIQVFVNGGRVIDSLYRYDYYLTNSNNDTIRTIDNGISQNVILDSVQNFVLFDSLGVGNYTIHVVDSFGCTFDSTIYVMEPDNYTLHVSTSPNIVCEQDSTWIIIDSVSGGHPYLEYTWISPIGDSIFVRSGIYDVLIYDTVYKCKDTVDYILTAPNTIYCNVTSSIAPCFGTSSGSLSVDSIYGGVSPYFIQWGGIDTNNLFAGVYTLFVTDSLGCIYIEEHEVFENPDVNPNSILYPPSCFENADGSISINISGGNDPLNYNWLNGTGTPDSLFSLSEGIYILQTTDSFGCVYTDSIQLYQPDELEINLNGYTNPLACNGGQTLINANITGGTGVYSISWTNSSGSAISFDFQVVVPAGTYTAEVMDENGCWKQESITITEPPPLEITVNFTQATCNVGGMASVNYIGGTSPIELLWSTGEITSTVSDLFGGTYWVIVTDSCGNSDSSSFVIDEYVLETSIYYYDNLREAIVDVDNSTVGAPFTYQWYDENMNAINGETDNIIDDLCEAWYFVTTTDGNSCVVTDSVEATFLLPLGIVDENTTTVLGDASLWGAEPYTYLWDNGDITAHGNVCPGFHRVWVTDINGCEVVGELTVDEIILSLSPSDVIIECDITNLDVELEVTATGGIGQFTYLWNSGETSNPINISLNPGKYSVIVTDENNCSVDTAFTIAAFTSECIPNVFTPNNDGVNDVWSLEDAFFYTDSEVRIYGRYGRLMFKSVGYETPWDGTNEKGNPVEDGAYFYVIDLGDDIEKIKGTVSIIR